MGKIGGSFRNMQLCKCVLMCLLILSGLSLSLSIYIYIYAAPRADGYSLPTLWNGGGSQQQESYMGSVCASVSV